MAEDRAAKMMQQFDRIGPLLDFTDSL